VADAIDRFFASVAADLQPLKLDLCSDLIDDDYGIANMLLSLGRSLLLFMA